MIEIRNFAAMDTLDKEFVAESIAAETSKHEGLVTVTPEEILATQLGAAAFLDGDFAGFVRAKNIIQHEQTGETFQQIGTLSVLENKQNHGVAFKLVNLMSRIVAVDHVPYAFTGSDSTPVFQRVGYVTPFDGQLPAEAKSERGNQPMVYPKFQTPKSE